MTSTIPATAAAIDIDHSSGAHQPPRPQAKWPDRHPRSKPHTCNMCGAEARLYVCGPRCDEHGPATMRTQMALPHPAQEPSAQAEQGGLFDIAAPPPPAKKSRSRARTTEPGPTPTGQQAAVVDAFLGHTDLVIEAGAGAGKTSTLKMCAHADKRRGAYIVFGKANAAEAQRKFPANVVCKTAHGFAMAAVGNRYRHRLFGTSRIPAWQAAGILGINEPAKLAADFPLIHVRQIARIAVDTVRRFTHSADPEITAAHLPRINGITQPALRAALATVVVPYAAKAWEDLCSIDGKLRFEHDHYLKMWSLTQPQFDTDYVLLDEAQDADPSIAFVVNGQRTAQRILVGDQCQPPGTLVTVVRGRHRSGKNNPALTVTEQVPIEQMQVGEHVVSYDVARTYLRRGGSPVGGITSRSFAGRLVVVRTPDGLTSRYTPDHHCVVRFGPELISKHVVYLMRRGQDYRIGVTGARVTSQSKRLGVVIRTGQEGADATWILSVHDTRAEAITAEMVAAWTYGVPSLTFKVGNNSGMTQDQLDLFWSKIGGNSERARAALSAHGRSIHYPLWERGERYLQTRRPTIVRACNLIDGMHVLPLTGAMAADGKRTSAPLWTPIVVEGEFYEGLVYSMTVDGDHTYVGDGIVTHNCQAIYGWRGAINAMEGFAGRRLPLSQSFRFGPAVADEANQWLRVLRSRLRLTGFDAIPSRLMTLEAPDAVLCRTNAQTINEVGNALGQGRKVAIAGGGDAMRTMAQAALDLQAGRGTDHPDLFAFTSWEEVRSYVNEEDDGADLRTFVSLIETHGADGVIALVDQLTDEKRADVVVSTAHKAKGREWKTVRIADDFPEPKTPEDGRRPPIPADAAMLAYVAVTRAQVILDRSGLAWVDKWAAS